MNIALVVSLAGLKRGRGMDEAYPEAACVLMAAMETMVRRRSTGLRNMSQTERPSWSAFSVAMVVSISTISALAISSEARSQRRDLLAASILPCSVSQRGLSLGTVSGALT